MKPIAALALALVLTLLVACAPSGPRSILAADLARHAGYLASDDLAGRYTGGPEVARAEEYVAAAFRSSGLQPLPGEDDYYVDFTAWRLGYDARTTFLRVGGAEPAVPPATLGTEFRPFDFSGLGELTAPLVFAGYGITAPEHDWDDYRGLDVRGKVVLLLRYEPREDDPASAFSGATHTSHAWFATKVRNAQAHGAAGMLLFTTPVNPPDEDLRVWDAWRLDPADLTGRRARNGAGSFLALQISQGYAERLAALAGTTLRDLHGAVDAGTPPAELGLPAGLQVTISVSRQGEPVSVGARNVVGYLPGRNTGEVVVVGAHHDHIGSFSPGGASGDADTIYNGADDNASGVAGVLELAQAFGRSRARPERGLVFATFSGEEQYLLGSQALAQSPLLAASKVTFMLNLDMIGRNPDEPVEVYGVSSGADLREMLDAANRSLGLDLEFPGEMPDSMSSDHASFQRRGAPVLFLHTGLHDDYHGLDDEADRLAYSNMERITRLAWRIVADRAGVR